MNYFFTADEHYYHTNIIKYCHRPFKDSTEMTEVLIQNHNKIVRSGDVTIHGGDFCFLKHRSQITRLVEKLNGSHIFVRGSHDKWMDKTFHEIWEKTFDNKHHIVVCHYALLVWPRSHYNSYHLFGHSHGGLNSIINLKEIQGKRYDIGVDNNNFYPVSLDQVVEIMKNKPDNFNCVKTRT